jgi:hypothetical protein
VIADYKAREEKKSTKSEDKAEKEKEIPKPRTPPAPVPTSPAPAAGPAGTHRKFALHRQIFEMRRDDIKRKEQSVKAREVGKGMSSSLDVGYWRWLISRFTAGP